VKQKITVYTPDMDEDSRWTRDRHLVHQATICVPLGDCVRATLGKVDPSTCEHLERNGFDQAPVKVPHAPLGWRLVATSHLRELASSSQPLTSHEQHFLRDDAMKVEMEGVAQIEYVVSEMILRPAAIVFAEQSYAPLDSDDQEPERLIVLFGLTTRSDLNRQAVRAAVYDRLATAEMALARFIRMTLQDRDWIRLLNEDAQARVLGWTEVSRLRGVDVDPVEATMLTDLINVVARSKELRRRLGYKSSDEYDTQMGRIAKVRNAVMHPVRPLVLGEDDLHRLRQVLESTSDLEQRIRTAMSQDAGHVPNAQ